MYECWWCGSVGAVSTVVQSGDRCTAVRSGTEVVVWNECWGTLSPGDLAASHAASVACHRTIGVRNRVREGQKGSNRTIEMVRSGVRRGARDLSDLHRIDATAERLPNLRGEAREYRVAVSYSVYETVFGEP